MKLPRKISPKRLSIIILVILSICLIGFNYLIPFPPFTYLAHEVYPKAPINLCFLSLGITWGFDNFTSNKDDCYQIRASLKNDWQSCLHTNQTGECLSSISLASSQYLCDKAPSQKLISNCNSYLLGSTGKDKIHTLSGIEKYKISRTVSLHNGDLFLLNPVSITPDQKVEMGALGWKTCVNTEKPPLQVNTVGGGPNFIYITGCKVNGDNIIINYFKYNLQGLTIPDEL